MKPTETKNFHVAEELIQHKPYSYKLYPLKKTIGIIAIAIVILGLVVATVAVQSQQSTRGKAAEAKTWTVCAAAGEGCQFVGGEGIQQAVNAAVNGDTIFIRGGYYRRNAYTDFTYSGKDGVTYKRKAFLTNEDSGGRAKNLTFEGDRNAPTVLEGSQSNAMGGIYFKAGEVAVREITVELFKVDETCEDAGEFCSAGDGIFAAGTAKVSLSRSMLNGNWGGGIKLLDSAQVTITTIVEKVSREVSINGNRGGDVVLSGSSRLVVNGPNVITAPSAVLYKTGAVIALYDDARITTSGGVQTLQGNNNEGIELNDRAQADLDTISLVAGKKSGIILRGNSQATIKESLVAYGSAAGIELLDSSRATITKSQVTKNEGGGIVLGGNSSATINNSWCTKPMGCGVTENGGGGIVVRDAATANIVGTDQIEKNKGYGIELYGNSQAMIESNTLRQNQKGGIYAESGAKARIVNNTLFENTAAGIKINSAETNPAVEAVNNLISSTKKDTQGLGGVAIGGEGIFAAGRMDNDRFAYNLYFNTSFALST